MGIILVVVSFYFMSWSPNFVTTPQQENGTPQATMDALASLTPPEGQNGAHRRAPDSGSFCAPGFLAQLTSPGTSPKSSTEKAILLSHMRREFKENGAFYCQSHHSRFSLCTIKVLLRSSQFNSKLALSI
jgi:hypothetical protein